MKVRWNKQSKEQLRQTAQFIYQKFGQKAREEFMQAVRQTNGLLADNPQLGPLEAFLADLPSQYRSIVVRHLNKIVYRIVENHIEVIAFWDCRREPNKLREQAIARKESAES